MPSNHLVAVGQTYFQHLTEAWRISGTSILGDVLMFYHGIFPDFLPKAAGNLVILANEILTGQRCKIDI